MAIINPGASVRVMPQAPQINARDFAPDAEGLQRAQLAGITLGKEIADLSLAGDRLKVEKAKLKAAEAAVKFGLQEAEANARRAIADAQNAETRNDPKELVRQEAVALGLNLPDYGEDFPKLQEDVELLKRRNIAFGQDTSLTQEQLRDRFGDTLAESVSGLAVEPDQEETTVDAPLAGVDFQQSRGVPPAQVPPAFMAPVGGTELAGAEVPGAAVASQELAAVDGVLTRFPELGNLRSRLAPQGTVPTGVALSRYAEDFPGRPFQSLSPNEQTKALKPYLDEAKPEVVSRTFFSNGNTYAADVLQSKDGRVVYSVEEPILQKSVTTSDAAKKKLAFIADVTNRVDTLLERFDYYEKTGAFGWFDALMSTTSMNPNRPLPIRAAANMLSNRQTNQLVSELAAIGAETMTELAGAAQTAGEAERLGPLVPSAGDALMNPEYLKDKLNNFRAGLEKSRDALKEQYGITPTQPLGKVETRSGSGRNTPAPSAGQGLSDVNRFLSEATKEYQRAVVPTAR